MKSIKFKLVFYIVLILLVTSTVLGSISYKKSSDAIINEVNNAIENLSIEGGMLVENKIQNQLLELQSIANKNEIKSMDWNIQKSELEKDIDYFDFLGLGIVHSDGTALYSDGSTAELGDREYVKKAFEGEANTSDLILSRVTDEMVLMFATPIKQEEKVVGVLIGRKPATALNETIKRIGFGENGYSYIIGKDGTMYAHENEKYVLNKQNAFKDIETDGELKNLGLAMQKMDMTSSDTITYEFLGNARYIGMSPIPNTDWLIGVGSFESEVLQSVKEMKTQIISTTIVIIVLASILIFILSSKLVEPIKVTAKYAEQIANLDITKDIPEKQLKLKDEVGLLARSVQSINQNLRNIVNEVKDASIKVASSSQELTATSEESAMVSEEISKTVEQIASAAEEQASDTEVGSSSAIELGKMVKANQENANKLSTFADKVLELKNEGNNLMKELNDKTINSSKGVRKVYEGIKDTTSNAAKITEASDLIKGIAQQTNLLALNASIEAARAGESGRGFAVVAEEIRKLAEESKESIAVIDNMVSQLQQSTDDSESTISDVINAIDMQQESFKQTEDKFTGIAESVEKIKYMINRLDDTSDLINKNQEDVISILNNLTAIAEENAASTQEVSAASEEQSASIHEIANSSESLSHLAQEMIELVDKFKI